MIPENVEILGQKIDLTPFKGLLNSVQDTTSSVAKTTSNQPPLKFSFSNSNADSWLLTTFLDELRIFNGRWWQCVFSHQGRQLPLDSLSKLKFSFIISYKDTASTDILFNKSLVMNVNWISDMVFVKIWKSISITQIGCQF